MYVPLVSSKQKSIKGSYLHYWKDELLGSSADLKSECLMMSQILVHWIVLEVWYLEDEC